MAFAFAHDARQQGGERNTDEKSQHDGGVGAEIVEKFAECHKKTGKNAAQGMKEGVDLLYLYAEYPFDFAAKKQTKTHAAHHPH
jgi:hypothetical protein